MERYHNIMICDMSNVKQTLSALVSWSYGYLSNVYFHNLTVQLKFEMEIDISIETLDFVFLIFLIAWPSCSSHLCTSQHLVLLGGISPSVLSVFFTDKFALSQSDARISVAYNSCQWKTLTKRLMKSPPPPISLWPSIEGQFKELIGDVCFFFF